MKIVVIRILLGRVTLKLRRKSAIAAILCSFAFFAVAARAITLRVVSYNIDCADQSSDNNITGSAHSLSTVIQAIGLHHIGTNAQPADIITCEELQSTTLSNFVVQLNAIYGSGAYTYDTTKDTNTGGGPDGIIYNPQTVQVVSARALRDGDVVLLQSDGSYTSAHSPGGGTNGVTRSPMVYQLRPIGSGFGTTNDLYIYVSHARSSSDNPQGDARYAEAQEVRSDAKYKLPAGSHILYAGDWNLFSGSGENAYLCLTGQTTSDSINWADTNLSLWANTNQTQGYDPTSKTSPPTTTTWANVSGDNANYLYNDSTGSLGSRLDIQLPNALMFAAYNSKGGVQLAPDTSDPFDTSNFPSSQYPYAFEVFGNNGSTPRSSSATSSANHSLDDLNSTTPNATTTKGDILLVNSGTTNFTGSDHYPIVGDYVIVTNAATPPPPTASFSATPTNGAQPLIVTFNDASTGSITNWSWNFGDGATTNTTNTSFSHTYISNGVFTVSETVSGAGGSNTLTRTNYITVTTPPPTAGFVPNVTNGIVPMSVAFQDASTGTVTNWFWNFGDGGTTNATTNLVNHFYTNAGVFTVAEIVTGPGGSSTNTQTNLITMITPFQAWQLQYFGCTNCPQAQPTADADGTGQNNLFKYIAGLNPTNPASIFVFGVTLPANSSAGPNLIFNPAVAGRTYTPQFETNLVGSNWLTLATISSPITNGSQVTITDTNAPAGQKYYRINIQLQ